MAYSPLFASINNTRVMINSETFDSEDTQVFSAWETFKSIFEIREETKSFTSCYLLSAKAKFESISERVLSITAKQLEKPASNHDLLKLWISSFNQDALRISAILYQQDNESNDSCSLYDDNGSPYLTPFNAQFGPNMDLNLT